MAHWDGALHSIGREVYQFIEEWYKSDTRFLTIFHLMRIILENYICASLL